MNGKEQMADGKTQQNRPVPEEYKDHPFLAVSESFGFMGITGVVEDRVRMIKESTDAAWLERVLRCKDLQTTVRLAAERRLRRLLKLKYILGRG